ncbi:hypothetical protein [Acinetobacter sp.]|uniref:hypothetical protein n=1 Tax=Acinetobacter sp. TaxID=472 RepID=UPI003D00D0D6
MDKILVIDGQPVFGPFTFNFTSTKSDIYLGYKWGTLLENEIELNIPADNLPAIKIIMSLTTPELNMHRLRSVSWDQGNTVMGHEFTGLILNRIQYSNDGMVMKLGARFVTDLTAGKKWLTAIARYPLS